MKTRSWGSTWWILATSSVIEAALIWGHPLRPRADQSASTENGHNEISEMVSYTKQGRYEDAVKLGLALLRNDPSDEIVYQQIADVYLVRAQNDRDHSGEWVVKAVAYVEKSLLLNSKERDVAGVHLLQDARSLELAGDLYADKRCTYYERARKLLQDRVSLLQGDQITLAGKTFPLEPLRKENDSVLTGVKAKATKVGCK